MPMCFSRFYLSAVFMGLLGVTGPAAAQPQEAAPEAQESPAAQINELAGYCLDYQKRRRALQHQRTEALADPNYRLETRIKAMSVLRQAQPDPAAAEENRRAVRSANERITMINDILTGHTAPEQPGLTIEALTQELIALERARSRYDLLAEVNTIDSPVVRQRRQAELEEEVAQIRELVVQITLPIREGLEALEAMSVRWAEAFEDAMQALGKVDPDSEFQVEEIQADAWFQHGLVSYRWKDRQGRLVASAQIRLRAQSDGPQAPPLLRERFAVLDHTENEIALSVGYFVVFFHSPLPEFAGEASVEQMVQRLLDLDAIADVRPGLDLSSQN